MHFIIIIPRFRVDCTCSQISAPSAAFVSRVPQTYRPSWVVFALCVGLTALAGDFCEFSENFPILRRGRCPHRSSKWNRFYGNPMRIRWYPTGRCGPRPLRTSSGLLGKYRKAAPEIRGCRYVWSDGAAQISPSMSMPNSSPGSSSSSVVVSSVATGTNSVMYAS